MCRYQYSNKTDPIAIPTKIRIAKLVDVAASRNNGTIVHIDDDDGDNDDNNDNGDGHVFLFGVVILFLFCFVLFETDDQCDLIHRVYFFFGLTVSSLD
mmetsp:Transcript_51556/g.57590  ORF Transcript_51556/g.57590 Transcript_51556/m.57590 type:complete len:98 (-) Transcript_51556:69-362(-)